MRKSLFFILIAIVSVGIIMLNTSNALKYLICEDPSNLKVEVTAISDTEITIEITKDTHNETFSEFVYHIKDGTLYVGAKYALNPLSDDDTYTYTETIQLNEPIDRVVVKGGVEEIEVYPE